MPQILDSRSAKLPHPRNSLDQSNDSSDALIWFCYSARTMGQTSLPVDFSSLAHTRPPDMHCQHTDLGIRLHLRDDDGTQGTPQCQRRKGVRSKIKQISAHTGAVRHVIR